MVLRSCLLLQSGTVPVVAIAVIAGVSVLLLGIAAREVWIALRYRSLRPTPVGELDDASGRVVVTGTVERTDEVLTAPLTGRECLAYLWRVTDFRTLWDVDGDRRVRRENIGQGRDSVPFLVADYSGSVRVDPTGAEFRLAEEWIRDPVNDPVERADVLTGGDQLGGEALGREYFESRLDEGETVTVRGRVAPDDDTLHSIRQVGVLISGRGTLIDDATTEAASNRAFRQAAYAGLTGLFMLLVLGIVTGVVPF